MQGATTTKLLLISLFLAQPFWADISPSPSVEQIDFARLLLAVAWLVFGLYLVRQASTAQEWLMGERSGSVSPYAGQLLSWLWVVSVLTLWSLRYMSTRLGELPTQFMDRTASEIWGNPQGFVGGVLIAALVPNLIAVVKNMSVLASWSTLYSSNETRDTLPPESGTLMWQISSCLPDRKDPARNTKVRAPTKIFSMTNFGLSVLSITANIASLIDFFKLRG